MRRPLPGERSAGIHLRRFARGSSDASDPDHPTLGKDEAPHDWPTPSHRREASRIGLDSGVDFRRDRKSGVMSPEELRASLSCSVRSPGPRHTVVGLHLAVDDLEDRTVPSGIGNLSLSAFTSAVQLTTITPLRDVVPSINAGGPAVAPSSSSTASDLPGRRRSSRRRPRLCSMRRTSQSVWSMARRRRSCRGSASSWARWRRATADPVADAADASSGLSIDVPGVISADDPGLGDRPSCRAGMAREPEASPSAEVSGLGGTGTSISNPGIILTLPGLTAGVVLPLSSPLDSIGEAPDPVLPSIPTNPALPSGSIWHRGIAAVFGGNPVASPPTSLHGCAAGAPATPPSEDGANPTLPFARGALSPSTHPVQAMRRQPDRRRPSPGRAASRLRDPPPPGPSPRAARRRLAASSTSGSSVPVTTSGLDGGLGNEAISRVGRQDVGGPRRSVLRSARPADREIAPAELLPGDLEGLERALGRLMRGSTRWAKTWPGASRNSARSRCCCPRGWWSWLARSSVGGSAGDNSGIPEARSERPAGPVRPIARGAVHSAGRRPSGLAGRPADRLTSNPRPCNPAANETSHFPPTSHPLRGSPEKRWRRNRPSVDENGLVGRGGEHLPGLRRPSDSSFRDAVADWDPIDQGPNEPVSEQDAADVSTVTTRDRPARMADESARGKDARGLRAAFDRPTPASGDELAGFRLLAVLGRGAEGTVYLATQTELADRPVVLKVGPLQGGEHRSLARLQHTHIVPILSSQDLPERGLRILCLPYLGGTTLEHLLDELASRPPAERSGSDLLEVLDRAASPAAVSLPAAGPAREFLAAESYERSITLDRPVPGRGAPPCASPEPRPLGCQAGEHPPGGGRHALAARLPPGATAPVSRRGEAGVDRGHAPVHRSRAVRRAGGADPGPAPPAVDARADVYALAMVLHIALADERPSDENPDRRPIASARTIGSARVWPRSSRAPWRRNPIGAIPARPRSRRTCGGTSTTGP